MLKILLFLLTRCLCLSGFFLFVEVHASTLQEMESVVAQARNFDDFVQRPRLVEKYAKAVKAYFGRDQFSCETFQKIFSQARELANKVPEIKQRLWESTDLGQRIELKAGNDHYLFRVLPRRIHGLWTDPSPCKNRNCLDTESTTPERWAILLKDSQLYLLEKDNRYLGAGVLVSPVRRGADPFALVLPVGTSVLSKEIQWTDEKMGMRRKTSLLGAWLSEMTWRRPRKWLGYVVTRLIRMENRLKTNETPVLAPSYVDEHPIGPVREFATPDPLAMTIASSLPKKCFHPEENSGPSIALGDALASGGTLGMAPVSLRLNVSDPKIVLEILNSLELPKNLGLLAYLDPKQVPELQSSLADTLSNSPDPRVREKAAAAINMLNPNYMRSAASFLPEFSKAQQDLGQLRQKFEKPLTKALRDPSPEVRGLAGVTLVNLGAQNPDALDRVSKILELQGKTRDLSSESVPNSRDSSISALERQLILKRLAAEALLHSGRPISHNQIGSLAQDLDKVQDPNERKEDARLLADIWFHQKDPAEAMRALHDLRKGPNPPEITNDVLDEIKNRKGECDRWKASNDSGVNPS